MHLATTLRPTRRSSKACGIVTRVDAPSTPDPDRTPREPTWTGPKARTRLYQGGAKVLEDFPLEDISDHLAKPDAVVWIDLCRPDAADLAVVAAELGLHRLAVADATDTRQRPKLDHYDTHEFINMYAVDRTAGAA